MKGQHYHFIGIGGIGMGALASLLIAKGYRVSGSDIRENQIILKLRDEGANIFLEHNPINVEGVDTVIYSSAINPESLKYLIKRRLQSD